MIFTIKLENMEFRASHGCYELEKRVGNRFSVNAEIDVMAEEAARADDVSRTVNYLSVYEVIDRQMRITSNTLENVSLRIAEAIREQFPQTLRVSISVSKLAPPLGGKSNGSRSASPVEHPSADC